VAQVAIKTPGNLLLTKRKQVAAKPRAKCCLQLGKTLRNGIEAHLHRVYFVP
jgi:hypothetical protein